MAAAAHDTLVAMTGGRQAQLVRFGKRECVPGNDAVPFAVTSDKVFFGLTRHYGRFSQAAALSRLYAGPLQACEYARARTGTKYGQHVCTTFLPARKRTTRSPRTK